MKLAEALLLRSDIQKKLESLRERLSRNVLIQEGEEIFEKPDDLLKEAMSLADELEGLVFRINKKNLESKTEKGRSLTEAIAHKDALSLKHSLLNSSIQAAMKPTERYGMKEIRWVKTVDLSRLQKDLEGLAKAIRECNVEIQAANWSIDL